MGEAQPGGYYYGDPHARLSDVDGQAKLDAILAEEAATAAREQATIHQIPTTHGQPHGHGHQAQQGPGYEWQQEDVWGAGQGGGSGVVGHHDPRTHEW
jgi:hypothetical protein